MKKQQTAEEGTGALFYRRYRVDVPNPNIAPEALMDRIKEDLNRFSPAILASFEKTKGTPGPLALGDEFAVHIPGPWQAPVRVSESKPTAFSLVTLEGHPEAGAITFTLRSLRSGALRFSIESIARSHDSVVDFLYDKVPLMRMAQTLMWQKFCEAVAQSVAPSTTPQVIIETERVAVEEE